MCLNRCKMARLRGSNMLPKDVVAAHDNSAHGAAHLDTDVSEDVPRHASLLEDFGAALPNARYIRIARGSNSVPFQVFGDRTGCASHK